MAAGRAITMSVKSSTTTMPPVHEAGVALDKVNLEVNVNLEVK